MTTLMFYVVPVYHVRAVAGQQARLPCDISLVSDEEDDLSDPGADSPPLDGESSLASGVNLRDAVLLVLWYRDDLGTPIYRYLWFLLQIARLYEYILDYIPFYDFKIFRFFIVAERWKSPFEYYP